MPTELERLLGVFRCFLPRRYWTDMGRGAYFSCLLTVAIGFRVGYTGLLAYAGRAAEAGAAMALKAGGGGVAGVDPTSGAVAAVLGSALAPLAFFLFTPTGWLADYFFLSGLFRAITIAAGNPWGDPVLTVIDKYVHERLEEDKAQQAASARAEAEGPEVPDAVVAGTQFAGKAADFVIVSSRRKEGWTLATTVVAGDVRLRLGDPVDRRIKGWLRTCYPLSVIRDLQVDRRVVFYEWPADAPPLPRLDAEPDPWARPEDAAAAVEGTEAAPPPSQTSAQTPPKGAVGNVTSEELRNRMS